jgi:hypothetical protein
MRSPGLHRGLTGRFDHDVRPTGRPDPEEEAQSFLVLPPERLKHARDQFGGGFGLV